VDLYLHSSIRLHGGVLGRYLVLLHVKYQLLRTWRRGQHVSIYQTIRRHILDTKFSSDKSFQETCTKSDIGSLHSRRHRDTSRLCVHLCTLCREQFTDSFLLENNRSDVTGAASNHKYACTSKTNSQLSWSRVSSVSIITRLRTESQGYLGSILRIQTGSGAHIAGKAAEA
jgi:hypothetical protein